MFCLAFIKLVNQIKWDSLKRIHYFSIHLLSKEENKVQYLSWVVYWHEKQFYARINS